MRYTAKIIQDDDSWLVEFPDHPNVQTYGPTLQKALYMAEEALNGALEADLQQGFRLIEPKTYEGSDCYAIPVDPCIEASYRLLEARRGRTQDTVAQAAGISQQAYQRLESGSKCNPTLRTLQKVAKAMGKHLEIRLV